jgi:hypothetical protein
MPQPADTRSLGPSVSTVVTVPTCLALPAVAGNRKTWTWSGGLKIVDFGAAGPSQASQTEINFDSEMEGYLHLCMKGQLIATSIHKPIFRDPSAWYHFVVVYNTTQRSMSDRVKIYVNGALQLLLNQDQIFLRI